MIVALRRSSGGPDSAVGAAAVPCSAVPHSMQNFAPGGFSAPHDGHEAAS